MAIAKWANILAMARCVSDVESRFDAAGSPAEAEGLVKSTLYVFWEVTTTRGRLFIDLILDNFDIISEISNIEAVFILDISVGDKADPNSQTFIRKLNMVDDLF